MKVSTEISGGKGAFKDNGRGDDTPVNGGSVELPLQEKQYKIF